jgi:hypothetical protein
VTTERGRGAAAPAPAPAPWFLLRVVSDEGEAAAPEVAGVAVGIAVVAGVAVAVAVAVVVVVAVVDGIAGAVTATPGDTLLIALLAAAARAANRTRPIPTTTTPRGLLRRSEPSAGLGTMSGSAATGRSRARSGSKLRCN